MHEYEMKNWLCSKKKYVRCLGLSRKFGFLIPKENGNSSGENDDWLVVLGGWKIEVGFSIGNWVNSGKPIICQFVSKQSGKRSFPQTIHFTRELVIFIQTK